MGVYIIAEIGINFNNSLENCFKLIDAAASAGCQAAKFQLFSAKHLYPKSAGKLDWRDGDKEYSYDIYDAVSTFELPEEWIPQLMEYCDRCDINFMSSVFDTQGLDTLVGMGLKSIKLSSYTITNLPLIEAAAETGLPIIMSTGGATLAETEAAVETVLRHHNELALLHCSIQYPTLLKDCNMGVVETLAKAFPEIRVGYSDHTLEISDAPVQSVYLGGSVVEKHITLDKKMEGPDHFVALEPEELKQMVADIRQAEQLKLNGGFVVEQIVYGNSAKICHDHERYLRDFCYMTLFTKRSIKTGERIRPQDISILRPGKKVRGLDPDLLPLFKKYVITAKSDLTAEAPLTWGAVFG